MFFIRWLHQRRGKSEEAHAAMKNHCAGGQFPSGDFGENAVWWWITILTYNLNVLMKRLVLGASWEYKILKAIRFGFIHIVGRVIEHSRRLFVRISKNHPSSELLITVRRRIIGLATSLRLIQKLITKKMVQKRILKEGSVLKGHVRQISTVSRKHHSQCQQALLQNCASSALKIGYGLRLPHYDGGL